MMDQDSSNSLNLLESNVEQNECEYANVEEMSTAHSLIQGVSTESFPHSFNDQLKELLSSPKYESTDETKGDESKTDIFETLENGFIHDIPSSDENKKQENESELIQSENNQFQINTSSSISLELPLSEGSDKENTMEVENIEQPSDKEIKESSDLPEEISPEGKQNDEANVESSEIEQIMNGVEIEDETTNQNSEDDTIMVNNSIDSKPTSTQDSDNVGLCKDDQSKEQIGRCIDFIMRHMLALKVKTPNNKYRIKECRISLTPVEDDEVDETSEKEDNILVIQKDNISCNVEDIQTFVKQGYESYNSKLRKELTTPETDIEYVAMDSPRAASLKSNSIITIHQDISLKKTSNKDEAGPSGHKTFPPAVTTTDTKDQKRKVVLQSLPPYLHKSIQESIRSFSRTDPNATVPKSIPVQTIIPFKQKEQLKEHNGYIVVTTGVIERTEPIIYLSNDTTLKDVFGGSVFTVVSHSLQTGLTNHGTPLVATDVIVSPPTSPGQLGTVRMNPMAAQPLLISTGARALSSGSVSPQQVSPVAESSEQESPRRVFLSRESGRSGSKQNQQVYRAFKSTPVEVSPPPVVRKRGRPPKNKYLTPVKDSTAGSPNSPEGKRFKEGKWRDNGCEKENGEYHCNCCKKNGQSHHDTSSFTNDTKPVNTLVDCDDCGKSYRADSNHKCMKKKGMKLDEKEFSCPECGRLFSKKAHLNNHMRSHKGYINTTVKCDICKERFKKGMAFLQHKEEFHPETLLSCDICDKSFLSQRQLDQHKRIHKQNDENDQPLIVRCVYCNGSFDLEHYETVHVQECSDNPNNNVSRLDGKITVRMDKPVAVRSKPFNEENDSSEDEDTYQFVEILDEHQGLNTYISEESEYEEYMDSSKKRKRNGIKSESDSDSEPRKKVHTAFRSVRVKEEDVDNEYLNEKEENEIDTDVLSEVENDLQDANYLRFEESGKNYIDVEEMMNDKFSAA